MKEKQLKQLYQLYIQAFAKQDIQAVKQCYLMPCTLNTPDRVVLLNNDEVFDKEFNDIFSLLNSENISGFKTSNASFDIISEHVVVVAIDWQFINDANNLFTEFTAIYHLTKTIDGFKIINVVSQDISQSINLSHPLIIDMESE
ncbi:hypothetical protein [Thalassotalea atypica]|uniref:hypothetical protein n=1 Tax=Thalassotalea atypica TaxID=2054316 RepID=UPI0025744872|nr:hypothetical protein [Thalassotalea atypica]